MCIHCKEEYDEQALGSAVELGILLTKAAEICLNMDTANCEGKILGSRVCYTEKMALDAVLVLQSVLSNRAIHNNIISSEDQAWVAGNKLYEALKDIFSFNAREAAYNVLDQEMSHHE